jgi:hypothetical protein
MELMKEIIMWELSVPPPRHQELITFRHIAQHEAAGHPSSMRLRVINIDGSHSSSLPLILRATE